MEKIGDLSYREDEVLRHFIQRKANKMIANILDLSTKTIGTHRAHIMRKLGGGNLYGWFDVDGNNIGGIPGST